ncbi:MAG: FKBP-type peptidyl-prolyl cis-trans isomerase, partial [Bifidobacteriaceae bacterium]|nr:FKBP-type peptidyl-prolyl cis-trans isomerase [Bifidobacteriaceae bacterium]
MRRPVAAGLALSLLCGLAACSDLGGAASGASSSVSSESSSRSEPSASTAASGAPEHDPAGDAAILAMIAWQASEDGQPVLSFDPPIGVTGPAARLVEDGAGQLIEEGDIVSFDYAMFAGDTGRAGYSTYGAGQPETVNVGHQGMSTSFAEALMGSHVGAKIIYARVDNSGTMISDYAITQFMAVTVTGSRTIMKKAEGEPVPPVAGLPKVESATDGEPSLESLVGSPPGALVAQPLILGAGAALREGQTAWVHYTGWLWDGGTMFDSTWATGVPVPWELSVPETFPGLVEGLIGKPVGSRILLIVPPAKGPPVGLTEAIPEGSTLVYVVDVLD